MDTSLQPFVALRGHGLCPGDGCASFAESGCLFGSKSVGGINAHAVCCNVDVSRNGWQGANAQGQLNPALLKNNAVYTWQQAKAFSRNQGVDVAGCVSGQGRKKQPMRCIGILLPSLKGVDKRIATPKGCFKCVPTVLPRCSMLPVTRVKIRGWWAGHNLGLHRRQNQRNGFPFDEPNTDEHVHQPSSIGFR